MGPRTLHLSCGDPENSHFNKFCNLGSEQGGSGTSSWYGEPGRALALAAVLASLLPLPSPLHARLLLTKCIDSRFSVPRTGKAFLVPISL